MENLIIAANTVLPLFLMTLAGMLCKKAGMITEETASKANGLCFRLFTSVLLFYNIYTVDLSAAFDGPLVLFCFLGVLAEFFVGIPLVRRLESRDPARGVMLQSFFRTNMVLFALPMSTTLFGEGNTGPIAILTAVIVPLVNVLAVIDLEMFRGGKPNAGKMLKGIFTNPLVIGALIGAVFLLLDIRLPFVLETTVRSLADVATPLALVLLGVSLDFRRFAADLRSLSISVVMRLLVFPAVFMVLAVVLGFRGIPLGCVMLTFAPPVAVASYTMAEEMGGDGELAAEIVVLTTAFSCLTMFFWIWLLKTLGLM